MATAALDKVKTDIALSKEWKALHEAISDEVKTTLKTKGAKNKEDILQKVSQAVKETREEQFQLLDEKASKIVQQHFFSSSKMTKPKPNLQQIDQASAIIIHDHPQFKTHLKSFMNVPIPPKLRRSAWNAFLSDSTTRKDFYKAHKKVKSVFNDQGKLTEKCENILERLDSSSGLRSSDTFPYVISAIVKYWEIQSPSETDDDSIFLCIPFIYCCRHGLAVASSTGATGHGNYDWTVASEVAEMYCRFMTILPLNMRNIIHDPQNAYAVKVLCKEIETLLSSTEPKLLAQLKKVLLLSKSKKHERRDADEFHKQLPNLIHPFVKKLFVGFLSMEVICFILDQCLIFTELRKTKFMPYCLATWMILLKKKIMGCREFDDVKVVLIKQSKNLTIEDFQKEIDARFISDLKLGNKIKISLAEEEQSDVDEFLKPSPVITRKRETDGNDHERITKDIKKSKHEASRDQATDHDLQHDLSILRQRVSDMSKEQIKREQEFHELLKKERESHLKDIRVLKQDINTTKEKVPSSPHHQRTSSSTRSQHSSLHFHRTARPSSSHSESLDGDNVPAVAKADLKKYNPDSLTPSDVRELNLILLDKFREAMYLVCHGTQEEKEQMQEILKRKKTA